MSERRIVIVLFVLVIITFSFAHEDSKKLEEIYSGFKPAPAIELTASETLVNPGVQKTAPFNASNIEQVNP